MLIELSGMWSIRTLDDSALVNSDPDHWSIRTFFYWLIRTFPLANSDLSRPFPLANSDFSRPVYLANSNLTDPLRRCVYDSNFLGIKHITGADPTRVHWVHVQPPPPCVRVTCS